MPLCFRFKLKFPHACSAKHVFKQHELALSYYITFGQPAKLDAQLAGEALQHYADHIRQVLHIFSFMMQSNIGRSDGQGLIGIDTVGDTHEYQRNGSLRTYEANMYLNHGGAQWGRGLPKDIPNSDHPQRPIVSTFHAEI